MTPFSWEMKRKHVHHSNAYFVMKSRADIFAFANFLKVAGVPFLKVLLKM